VLLRRHLKYLPQLPESSTIPAAHFVGGKGVQKEKQLDKFLDIGSGAGFGLGQWLVVRIFSGPYYRTVFEHKVKVIRKSD